MGPFPDLDGYVSLQVSQSAACFRTPCNHFVQLAVVRLEKAVEERQIVRNREEEDIPQIDKDGLPGRGIPDQLSLRTG
jgi:hypothetical protein